MTLRRALLLLAPIAACLSSELTAFADVGPAPPCPPGTYGAYLMGRRCVRDGYRLQQTADGSVEEVPIPGYVPQPEPAKPDAAKPDAAKPGAAKSRGGCALAGSVANGAASPVAVLTALAGLGLRLRRRRIAAR